MWDKIAEVAKDVAPTLATAVGGPAAGGAAKLLTSFFGGDDDPEKILQNMQADPEMTVKLKQIENEHAQELRRLAMKGEENRLEHDTQQTREINETMRAEYKQDVYWRRAVGWAFAITVVGFPACIFVSLWTEKLDLSDLPTLMGVMKEYWYAIGIVLGVGAHHAGKRERVQSGEKPAGGLTGLVRAIKEK